MIILCVQQARDRFGTSNRDDDVVDGMSATTYGDICFIKGD